MPLQHISPETKLTEMLDETDRGTNGFGSSGIQ